MAESGFYLNKFYKEYSDEFSEFLENVTTNPTFKSGFGEQLVGMNYFKGVLITPCLIALISAR